MGFWDTLFRRRSPAAPALAPASVTAAGPAVQAVREALVPWQRAHARVAWRPQTQSGEGEPAGSRFGGLPWLPRGTAHPTCGDCGRPLRLLVQLDLATLPPAPQAQLGTSSLLQALYCEGDDCIAAGPFDRAHLVRALAPGPGARAPMVGAPFPERRIVGWQALENDLPSPEEHEHEGLHVDYDFKAGTLSVRCPEVGLAPTTLPLDALESEELGQAFDKDKLLGWPRWVQNVEYPACPRCHRQMQYVFQLDSEDNLPWMWGDAGIAHVTRCPEHPDVLTLVWACH